MRYGYSTSRFPDHALPVAIELLQKIGYAAISIRLDARSLDPRPGNAMLPSQLAGIMDALDESTAVVLDTDARFLLDPRDPYGPSLTDTTESATSDLRFDLIYRTIEVAKRWNDATVVFSSGPPPLETQSDEQLERLSQQIARLTEHARERGVTICLRPWTSHTIASIGQFERLLQWLESPLDLASDITVMSRNSELPIMLKLTRHMSRLCAIYIDESPGIDRMAIVERLIEEGYSGPLIVGASDEQSDPVEAATCEFERCQTFSL